LAQLTKAGRACAFASDWAFASASASAFGGDSFGAFFRHTFPWNCVVFAVRLYVSTKDWLMNIDAGGVTHSRTLSAVTPRMSDGRGLA
jgi:hypothetical protein